MKLNEAMSGVGKMINDTLCMESGDLDFYQRKVAKHVAANNPRKVVDYIRIFYSFREVEKISAREYFSEAFEFLKNNDIKGRIVTIPNASNDESKYKQVLFYKNGEPYAVSHYPNGYEHFFAD